MKTYNGYNADYVAGLSFEDFKKECDEQTEAHPGAHFGYATDRDAKLKDIHDGCCKEVGVIPPTKAITKTAAPAASPSV